MHKGYQRGPRGTPPVRWVGGLTYEHIRHRRHATISPETKTLCIGPTLGAYLLPDDDASVQAVMHDKFKDAAAGKSAKAKPKKGNKARAKAKQASQKRQGSDCDSGDSNVGDDQNKTKKGPQYRVEHLDAYELASLSYPPQYTPEFAEKAGCLPPRQKELLWWWEHLNGPASKLTQWECRDLNLSIKWGKSVKGKLPTLTSTSWVWVRGPVEVQGKPLVPGSNLGLASIAPGLTVCMCHPRPSF